MKIYVRNDGFEVQDSLDRDMVWLIQTFGGQSDNWTDVTEERKAIIESEKQSIQAEQTLLDNIKASAELKLKRLGLTEEEIDALGR